MKYATSILALSTALALSLFSASIFAEATKAVKHAEPPSLIIDLPLYDSAYNPDFSAQNPSMTQALQVSKAFYQFSHYSIQSFWGRKKDAALLSIIAFDTIATWLPLSNGWLHEEWHRSVMGQYGIDSRNDIYDIQFFAETISVSHVSDADLISLKENHPADLIRLHTAGLESQNQLNLSIESDQFFENTQSLDAILIWTNTINTIAYLNTCSINESSSVTNDILSREGTDIADRDFTGLDCNAWVYDLFRPDEAYAERGIHPSGNGINRYITFEKLSPSEQHFLRKQYYLSFLNFIDPFLLNKRHFKFTSQKTGFRALWNANIKHYLTPFGYSINVHTYIKTKESNYLITLNNYFNKDNHFPGIGFDLISQPFQLGSAHLLGTIKTKIWQQPRQFSFTTSSSSLGGSISTRFEYSLTRTSFPYVEFLHKTSGWQEGNVYLNSNSSIILGFRFRA